MGGGEGRVWGGWGVSGYYMCEVVFGVCVCVYVRWCVGWDV